MTTKRRAPGGEWILSRNGYDVLNADSASVALRMCDAPPRGIDLLLTDVITPEMSGAELIARVEKKLPSVKVVRMSGYRSEAGKRRCLLNASRVFVQKALTPNTLLRELREALDRVGNYGSPLCKTPVQKTCARASDLARGVRSW